MILKLKRKHINFYITIDPKGCEDIDDGINLLLI